MTTNSPELAIQIYHEAKEKGFFALDAPVTGGDVGARDATLTIMVGGDQEAYHACKKIFEAMGNHIVYAPGFFIKHFIKDMRIAVSEAKERGLELPVLDEVLKMYGSLEENGAGDLGTQALIKYYG